MIPGSVVAKSTINLQRIKDNSNEIMLVDNLDIGPSDHELILLPYLERLFKSILQTEGKMISGVRRITFTEVFL